jgi:hypothetical protein
MLILGFLALSVGTVTVQDAAGFAESTCVFNTLRKQEVHDSDVALETCAKQHGWNSDESEYAKGITMAMVQAIEAYKKAEKSGVAAEAIKSVIDSFEESDLRMIGTPDHHDLEASAPIVELIRQRLLPHASNDDQTSLAMEAVIMSVIANNMNLEFQDALRKRRR